jgi:hypothetical protein
MFIIPVNGKRHCEMTRRRCFSRNIYGRSNFIVHQPSMSSSVIRQETLPCRMALVARVIRVSQKLRLRVNKRRQPPS